MFPLGIVFVVVGYALVYAAVANWSNGNQGPTVLQALGWDHILAGPGADTPDPQGGVRTGTPAPPFKTA